MIDFCEYRNLFNEDVGECLARLDYKEIENDEVRVYLTTENGDKVCDPLYMDSDTYGFENLPIGAIVYLSVNYKEGDCFAFIQGAVWLEDKYDLNTAVNDFYFEERRARRFVFSCSEHRLCTNTKSAALAERGESPVTPVA